MNNWLRVIRESEGLSQKDTASKVHIAQPSYCNIENGKRRPCVEVAKSISLVLNFYRYGCSWTKFFDEKDSSPEAT